MGSWTGLLPSRPAWDHRAARNQARWLTEVGRLHAAHRGVDEDSPYVLRGLENGKTQLERLAGGLVLEPHPRLFYQDQTFEPLNTYRGLENEKRQKEISSLVGRCCQIFWERRYPALETCSVPRRGLSSQYFRRPGCTAKLLVIILSVVPHCLFSLMLLIRKSLQSMHEGFKGADSADEQ